MHKSVILLATVLIGLFLPQTAPPPIVIPIQNPSFEQVSFWITTDSCGNKETWKVPGWTFGTGSSVLQLANPNPCTLDAAPPVGRNVAFVGFGSSFSQDLGPSIAGDGVYTLKFFVANYNYWYGGQYKAALFVGPTELCSGSGIAMGDFVPITVICPDQRASGELKLVFTSSGPFAALPAGPVSLTFTPQ